MTYQNTDREIWRKDKDNPFSPSIHVTARNGIGINCGSHVIVAPVEAWHECGERLLCVDPNRPTWKYKLAWWLLGYNQRKPKGL